MRETVMLQRLKPTIPSPATSLHCARTLVLQSALLTTVQTLQDLKQTHHFCLEVKQYPNPKRLDWKYN